MTRDYTDFMNMMPLELAAYARDHANGSDMIFALVHQLETEAAEATQAARLREELEEAEQRALMWREEAQAIQRQLDMVRG